MFAPDLTVSIWSWLRLAVFLPLLWFVPGWMATARWRGTGPGLDAFLTSLGLLFGTVLAFDAGGIPVTLPSLVFAVFAVALGVWALSGRPTLRFTLPSIGRPTWRELWWLLPTGGVVLSVIIFAVVDPLSGFDNIFRWNHLALMLVGQGSLSHYPPVTAADFRVYPWCDGIPPLVPVLNASIYLAAGSTAPALTVARIIVELGYTFALVWRIAHQLWGGRGARFAVLTLASSSLFGWSVGMGQETGLTGVMLLAMAAHGWEFHQTKTRRAALWVMAAAAGAALCRDYNLLYIPAGMLVLLALGTKRRHLLLGLSIAAAICSPWYIRNALLTGNPLYAHSLGGLLYSNPVHVWVLELVRQAQGPVCSWANLAALAPDSGIGFGPLWLLSLPGLLRLRRDSGILLMLTLTGVTLWIISVPYTGGGSIYALRTFGPVLPLMAVAAGWWATYVSRHAIIILSVVLMSFCADAARRSWIFAARPFQPITPYSWAFWRDAKEWFAQLHHPAVWRRMQAVIGDELVFTDHPTTFMDARHVGLAAIPPYSSEAAALILTPEGTTLHSLVTTLRQQRIRFVVLSEWNGARGLVPTRGIQMLRRFPADVAVDGLWFYDIQRMADQAAPDGRFIGEASMRP